MSNMQFIVTIRKDVPDKETADELYELVKQRLADKPGLKYSATFTNHYPEAESDGS